MTALALPGVDTLPPERLRQKALSQWFTDEATAQRLTERMVGRPPGSWRVLEPSAGSGALIRALLSHSPAGLHVDAVELDPRFAAGLSDLCVHVECCDYLTRPAPAEPYDLVLMNPPYEGGLDSEFLEKAMRESRCVVALVRLALLESQRSYDRVWSRVRCFDWAMTDLAVFTSRPEFLAAGEDVGGGKTAFAAVRLSRFHADRQWRGTTVEWW